MSLPSSLRAPPPLGTPMLPIDTFKGKVVYITGGGTGLGKGIAMEFARCGATIVIASRSAAHRDAGIADIEIITAQTGARVIGSEVDIRVPEKIKASFDEVEAAVGPVDILINNAAGNFEAPAERMSPNAWRTVVDIVLNGTFFCSQEFAKRGMARKAGGAILNIGATYAWTGGPGTAHSAAAKAGVDNMTKSLAVEWVQDDIRVNGLAPGYFPAKDRSGGAAVFDAVDERIRALPAGRAGETRELGWVATYMCSPSASYLTGHTMVLDGANWLRRNLRMPEFEPVRDVYDREKTRNVKKD